MIGQNDNFLKKQLIKCFAVIASHSSSLAEDISTVLDANSLVACLKDPDANVRYNTAECIMNMVKHNAESAKLVSTGTGPHALIEYIENNRGAAKNPALAALSSIASFDSNSALNIITINGIPVIKVWFKIHKFI